MNIPVGQLETAINCLPEFESYSVPYYTITIIKDAGAQSKDDRSKPFEVAELRFRKNDDLGEWELIGVQGIQDIFARFGANPEIDKNEIAGHAEFEMVNNIMLFIYRSSPIVFDYVAMIDKVFVAGSEMRKAKLFYKGVEIGTMEYIGTALFFKPAKAFSKLKHE